MVDDHQKNESSVRTYSKLQSSEEHPCFFLPRVELLVTGNELIEGRWQDQHSFTMAKELKKVGGTISRFNTVGDHLEELKVTLNEIVHRADVCIMTGGLGPTSDDLTVDVLAQVAEVEAPIIEEVWTEILGRFPQLKAAERSNRRQARLPFGAEHLNNPLGTAPIIKMQIHSCTIFALPGVPKEFSWAFEHHVLTWLKQNYYAHIQDQAFEQVIRVGLIGESAIAERIDSLSLNEKIQISYQSLDSEHRIKVSAPNQSLLNDALNQIIHVAEEHYLNSADLSLSEQLILEASQKGITFGFAESCTGGGVSAAVTQVPGSSTVFYGSIVSYANSVKQNALNVSSKVLETEGAVSESCAKEMALGARVALGVDWAVSITGIAGPGGGSVEKPVGTVCFAQASDQGVYCQTKRFSGQRSDIQRKAIAFAQFQLLKCIQK